MATAVPTSATFLLHFPEYSRIPTAGLVETKLAEAARRTNGDVYPSAEATELAVLYRAALLLALSPDARKMRLVTDEQAYVWKGQLKELQVASTMGLRVF